MFLYLFICFWCDLYHLMCQGNKQIFIMKYFKIFQCFVKLRLIQSYQPMQMFGLYIFASLLLTWICFLFQPQVLCNHAYEFSLSSDQAVLHCLGASNPINWKEVIVSRGSLSNQTWELLVMCGSLLEETNSIVVWAPSCGRTHLLH